MDTQQSSATIRATTPTPEQDLLDRIEAEIARLHEKRPQLSDRIDRASHILVTHLACPRHRPIRVRVRDGRATFLVNGSKGAVYTVSPTNWSCSCPDYHCADLGACKHSVSCFILYRASRPPRKKAMPCQGCGETLPREALVEVHHEDYEMYWPGDFVCRECCRTGGVE